MMEDRASDATAALGWVTVYSIQGCPHCVQAKATLGRLGVPVRSVDVGRHPELRARVKQLSAGRSTVPQIFFNSAHVGGNDDLQKLSPEALGELVELVRKEPVAWDALPLPDDTSADGSEPPGEPDGEFSCERDELASLVEELKQSTVIGSHWKGLSLIKKSFSGDELTGWLHKEKGMARAHACETGRALLQKKYMVSVCDHQEGHFEEGANGDSLYRLLEHDPHSALNAGQTAACVPLKGMDGVRADLKGI